MLNYIKVHWQKILNIGLFIASLFIFFYILKLSFIYAAPIYFALLFYAIYRPSIKFLHKRGLPYKWSTVISVTLTTIIILGLFASIGTLLFFQAQNVFHNSPQWISWAETSIDNQISNLKSQINQVPNSVTENAKEQLNSFTGKIGDWMYGIATALFTNVSLITKIVIQIVMGYILSIFLAFEWPRLKKFLSENIPNSVKTFSMSVFGDTAKGLGSFIKAQLILITCTFIIVWIALSFLKIENALFLAFISGIFDVLPLLGVSTLFAPWVIYLFIIGKKAIAIKLAILWLIIVVFRQVMEPRITGDSLGISPFIMLAAMVICVAVLGFIGLILAPVILVIIKSLWEKGYFHLWLFNTKPK